jgi:hypothetical protein
MIQAHLANNELSFRIARDIFNQIGQWSYSVDKAVFKEQLATGRFRNHEIGAETLALMRHVEQRGKIMPYYGVGGSSGVCTYQFRFATPECHLLVEHGATGQILELRTPGRISWFAFRNPGGGRFKFSSFPYLIKGKLPQEWSGRPSQVLVCRIAGREYQKLASWSNWNVRQALTNRYEYSFGEVSMGATGFVAKVEDTSNGETIDVTDYADW